MRLVALSIMVGMLAGPVLAQDDAMDSANERVTRTAETMADHIPKPTERMQAWIDVCIENLSSGDINVGKSVSAALRAVGPGARPALQEAAKSENPVLAARAKKLLDRGAPRGRSGEAGNARRSGAGTADVLADLLNLTDEQKPQVTEIFEELKEKQLAVSKDIRSGQLDRDAGKARVAALRADADAKLAEVLSEEQLTAYDEIKVQRQGQRSGSRGTD